MSCDNIEDYEGKPTGPRKVPMKVNLPYVSALAICRATDEEIRYTRVQGPVPEGEGTPAAAIVHRWSCAIEVLFKGREGKAEEWVKVFETEKVYGTEDEACAAVSKFCAKVKDTTPWAGREWPVEKGPVPFGFIIAAGESGKRLLARARKANAHKGPRHQPPRRR